MKGSIYNAMYFFREKDHLPEYQSYPQTNTTLSTSNEETDYDEVMIPHRIDLKKYFINPDRQIPRRSSFTDVENVLKAETSTLSLPKRERQCISLPRCQIEGTNLLESPCSNVNTISNSSPSSSNDSPESSSLASSQEICITTASSVTSDASTSTSPIAAEYRLFEADRRDPNLSNQRSEMSKQEIVIKGNTPEKNKVEEVSETDNLKSDSSPHTNSWNERKLRYTRIQEKGEPPVGHKDNVNTYEKYPVSATPIASSLSNNNEDIIKPFPQIPLHHRPNQDARNSPKSMPKATASPLLQEKCNNKVLHQCTYEKVNMHDKSSNSDTIPIKENKSNINSNENQVNSPCIGEKEQVVKVRPKPQTRTSVEKLVKNAIIQSNENTATIKSPGIHSENGFLSDISSKAGNFKPTTPVKQTILKGKLENNPGLVSEDFPKTNSFHHSPNKQYLTVSPSRHFSSDSPSSIPLRNISDSRATRGTISKPIQEPVILCNKQVLKRFPYPEAAPLKNTRMSTSVPISPVQTPKRVTQPSRLQSEGSKSPLNKPEVPGKPSHGINTKGSRIPISKATRSVASPPKPNRLVMNRLTNPYGGLRHSSNNTSAPRKNLPSSNIENNMHPENLSLVTEHSFQSPPISEVTHKESNMFKNKQNANEYFESTANGQSPAMTANETTMMNKKLYADEEETYCNCSMKQTNLDEIESSKMPSREEIPTSRNHNSFIRSSSCEVLVGSPTKVSPTTNFAVEIPIEEPTETSHTRSRPEMTITETSELNQENYNDTDMSYNDTVTLPTGFNMAIEEEKEKHRSFKQDAAAQTSQLDLYEENYQYFQGGKEMLQCRQHDAAAQTHLETEVIERSPEENGAETLMFEFASTSSLTASLPMSARQAHHHIKMGGASLKPRPSSEMVEMKQQKCYKANHLYQSPLESSRSYEQIQQIVFMEEGQARLYDLKPVSCQNVHIISPNNKSYVSGYCSANSQEFSISAEQNAMKPSYIDQSQTVFPRSELKKKLSSSLASGLNESLYSSNDSYIFHSNNSLKETTYSEFEPRRRRTASLSNIEYERRMDSRKNQKRSRISAFFDKFQRKKKPSILANDVDVPTHFRVIGRILEMCLDGTRIIELTQPPHGLCGIYMTRVQHNLGYSIYVSRFSDGYPAKMFAGLLSIGDEILEINGISTVCMTVEDAHDMVASCDKLILRVLPNRNIYRTT